MKSIGILLSGCGVYDGSEIHESIITMLAIDRSGARMVIIAPDIEQLHVIDHQRGAVAEGEHRYVMRESARIARGAVLSASEVEIRTLDALIIPGGYGAAKNLCDFAIAGPDCRVESSVERLIRDLKVAQKVIGAICIAPVMLVKALQPLKLQPIVTIGNDEGTAEAIRKMGGRHQICAVDEIVIDEKNKLVSTPAYMLAQRISEAAAGIEKLVAQVVAMC